MATPTEIKHWLAIVANARLATARILAELPEGVEVDTYDLHRVADHLEQVFADGLEAHGQAVLREYVATREPSIVA